MLADQLVAGPQVEMVGVGEQDPHAQVLRQVALGQALDGGLRAHGHEYGRLDGSMRGMQQARAGAGVRALGHYFEGELGQLRL